MAVTLFDIAVRNASRSVGQNMQRCAKSGRLMCEETLFRQPKISHLGDCPIYSLPLLADQDE
eukprot:scaffold2957_cov134-Skeletonema_menzelii.AAC.5